MKTPKNPVSITESDIRILKISSCPSVSGKSTLTYHIGCTGESDIQLRIYDNTAAGFFSKEWLPLKNIEEALAKGSSHFTSFVLQPLFRGKSMNNPAFLLAVLLKLGLVTHSSDKKRYYEKVDASAFMAEIKALIESKVILNADDKLLKVGKKKEPNSPR
jgi:hypothetical protein